MNFVLHQRINYYFNIVKSYKIVHTHIVQHTVHKRYISLRFISHVLLRTCRVRTKLQPILKIMTFMEPHFLYITSRNCKPLETTACVPNTIEISRCEGDQQKNVFKLFCHTQKREQTAYGTFYELTRIIFTNNRRL